MFSTVQQVAGPVLNGMDCAKTLASQPLINMMVMGMGKIQFSQQSTYMIPQLYTAWKFEQSTATRFLTKFS